MDTGRDQTTGSLRPVTTRRLSLYFLKLGATGFGGPIALAGEMQRTLVERRAWIDRDEFLEGLALAQLAPGPLAAQLAMYLGYVRGGWRGATLVGFAFILPSFLMVWALAAAYVRTGGLWWMQALFYGIGACVIGIMARSVVRLARLSLKANAVHWAIATTLALTTAWTGRESLTLFFLAGFVPVLWRASHARMLALMAPVGLVPATIAAPTLMALGWFFTQAGASVFGSGLAVVPFLYGGIVLDRHWLSQQQFLDAVAIAMVTPGPVVITVAFIGYLLRGIPGMFVAAAGVFLPVYLVVVALAPWFHRVHRQEGVRAFVGGVTAAATGAIAGAVVVLGRRAVIDTPTLAIVVVTCVVLWRWRASELWLIGASGVTGLCLHWS